MRRFTKRRTHISRREQYCFAIMSAYNGNLHVPIQISHRYTCYGTVHPRHGYNMAETSPDCRAEAQRSNLDIKQWSGGVIANIAHVCAQSLMQCCRPRAATATRNLCDRF